MGSVFLHFQNTAPKCFSEGAPMLSSLLCLAPRDTEFLVPCPEHFSFRVLLRHFQLSVIHIQKKLNWPFLLLLHKIFLRRLIIIYNELALNFRMHRINWFPVFKQLYGGSLSLLVLETSTTCSFIILLTAQFKFLTNTFNIPVYVYCLIIAI